MRINEQVNTNLRILLRIKIYLRKNMQSYFFRNINACLVCSALLSVIS